MNISTVRLGFKHTFLNCFVVAEDDNSFSFQATEKAVSDTQRDNGLIDSVFAIKLDGILTVVHDSEANIYQEITLKKNRSVKNGWTVAYN